MEKDPNTMSAEELRDHIAALKDDLEEALADKAFLQRLTRTQMPGHQIERYEVEIASLEAAIERAESLLTPPPDHAGDE
jgi:hypothetical protein